MGVGSTKVVLQNNIIKEGRYGYNQQGHNISSVIIDNQFINNNHEDNPMNGGSGISIYGYSTECKAKIRNNTIIGNLWGITSIYFNEIDLGTRNDWGYNQIHDNGNGGVIYDLYNNSSCDIKAIGNYWGTSDEQEIEDHIVHQLDDPSLGLVNYLPFLDDDGVNETPTTSFTVSPNPVSNDCFTLTLEKAIPTEVVIYNVNGQVIKSQSIDNQINTINVETLKSGVYFVQIKNNESKNLKKIIIQ